MARSFSTPLDVKRPYGSFRFDVFSLKADRRMTLYGKAALCQFIELESDFEVTALCERPLLIPDIKPKRLVDFWALNGGIPTFYILVRQAEAFELSKEKRAYNEFKKWVNDERAVLKEVLIDDFGKRRVCHDNWASILQHLVTHKGQVTPALLDRCAEEMPKAFTLNEIEQKMVDFDEMLVRAAVFTLLANGNLVCPTLETQHLTNMTEVRRL